MAQTRLSDFFSSVSKRTRNENEDKTVEQLKLNQKASKMRKTSKKLRKGNRLRLHYENSELSGSSCILGWTIIMGKCFVCGVVSMVT